MARRRAQAALGGIAFAVAVVMAACEGPPARSKPWRHASRSAARPATGAPAQGDGKERVRAETAAWKASTLRIHLATEPTHLNPLLDIEVEGRRVVEDTIFETLLRHVRGPNGSASAYAPALAKSFSVSPDGREIRFALREAVSFHDGGSFSAADVQFSIDAARLPAPGRSSRLKALLADVATVEVWGPRDLRVTLRRPNAYVLRALAEVPILPAHAYGANLARSPKNRAPIGTGPYRFVAWEKGARIALSRWEGYWGERPAIKAIEFVVEPDAAQALVRARRDEIDVLPSLIPEHYPEQAAVPAVARSFAPLRLRPPWFRYVAVNTRRPPFDDPRVRRAAAMLIDRDRLVADVYDGLARPVGGPIWPGGPGDAEAPPAPRFDPVSAARLLEEAGWHDDDKDGVREKDGRELRVALLVTADGRNELERDVIVTGWRKAGFGVEVRPGESAFLLMKVRAGDFDAALMEWRGRVDDDVGGLLCGGGAHNVGGFVSERGEAACGRLRVEWEPAGRAEPLRELAKIVAEEAPILATTATDPFGLVHRRVQGLVVHDGWFSVRGLSLR